MRKTTKPITLSEALAVISVPKETKPIPLSEALAVVGTPRGRAIFKEFLANEPFPHFEQHPRLRDALIRVDQVGTRTAGRFVNREFVPLKRNFSRSTKKT